MKLQVPPVRGLSELQAYGLPSSSWLTRAEMASAPSVAIIGFEGDPGELGQERRVIMQSQDERVG